MTLVPACVHTVHILPWKYFKTQDKDKVKVSDPRSTMTSRIYEMAAPRHDIYARISKKTVSFFPKLFGVFRHHNYLFQICQRWWLQGLFPLYDEVRNESATEGQLLSDRGLHAFALWSTKRNTHYKMSCLKGNRTTSRYVSLTVILLHQRRGCTSGVAIWAMSVRDADNFSKHRDSKYPTLDLTSSPPPPPNQLHSNGKLPHF